MGNMQLPLRIWPISKLNAPPQRQSVSKITSVPALAQTNPRDGSLQGSVLVDEFQSLGKGTREFNAKHFPLARQGKNANCAYALSCWNGARSKMTATWGSREQTWNSCCVCHCARSFSSFDFSQEFQVIYVTEVVSGFAPQYLQMRTLMQNAVV
jgi:hypothetical protein